MRKLFIALLVLVPVLAIAQDENPPLAIDFYKAIRGTLHSFVLNDHVNIMHVNLDGENSEVVAINDQMQATWRTKLKGYVIASGKLKDKIYAVACTEYSAIKRNNNTFIGYVLDPTTGKVLVDKVIFDGKQDYMTFPYVFDGDGNFLKLAVRQSAFERRLHVAMPSLLATISINKYQKQYNQTTDFDVIEFNDKLEPVNKFKPVFNAGTFITMDCSKSGDTFIGWYDNGNISVVKYDEGKTTPSSPLVGSVMLDEDVLDSFGLDIVVRAGETNSNAAYYAVVFRNADKETELGIGKLDFSTGKTQYVNEVFSKDHAKDIKKSFVPVNKKLHSVDLGSLRSLNVRDFYQKDGKVMVALSSITYSSAMNSSGTVVDEYNILVNCYDADLNTKFQQVIPTSYAMPERNLSAGFHFDKNKLYVLSNDKEGMMTVYGTYSCIDLATGKCEKTYWLSKKKINNSDTAFSSAVLWFSNGFVVPYQNMRGFSGGKFDITLQQNSY